MISKRERNERQRRYYYQNREKRIAYQKEWDRLNKDKKRKYDKKRRGEKNDNIRKNLNHYSQRHHYPILIKKYKHCMLCPSTKKLEIHHIRYTKKIEDVMLLCQECHKKMHRID